MIFQSKKKKKKRKDIKPRLSIIILLKKNDKDKVLAEANGGEQYVQRSKDEDDIIFLLSETMQTRKQ